MLPALLQQPSAQDRQSPQESQHSPIREYVFAEHGRDGTLQHTSFMTMVRGECWKLVSFLDDTHGQLFNLREDPEELHNLWDDPEAAVDKRELLETMREWLVESNYRTQGWSSEWR